MSCRASGCKGNWWQRRWICLDRCVVCCRLFCEECLYEEQDHLYCSNCLLLSFDSSLHPCQMKHLTNSELCFYVSLFNLHNSPKSLENSQLIDLILTYKNEKVKEERKVRQEKVKETTQVLRQMSVRRLQEIITRSGREVGHIKERETLIWEAKKIVDKNPTLLE